MGEKTKWYQVEIIPDIIGLGIIGIVAIIGTIRGDTAITTGCTGIIGGYISRGALSKQTDNPKLNN